MTVEEESDKVITYCDRLFESRQAADYVELSEFEVDQVKLMLNDATV